MEQATRIPPKGLGKIQLSDFLKSLLLAAFMNVILSLYTIINAGGWPSHADWVTMAHSTIAMILAYLLKNFGTNNVGQFLKKDKPVVTVGAEQLKDELSK